MGINVIVIEILAEIFYFVWSLIFLTLSIKEDLFVYFWFLYVVFMLFVCGNYLKEQESMEYML